MDARVQAVELLASHRVHHDGLHVKSGLHRLSQLLIVIGEDTLLVYNPFDPVCFVDDGFDGGVRFQTLIGIRYELTAVVYLSGLKPVDALRRFGHRDEQDLVHIGHFLSAIAILRLFSRRVFVEALHPDVAVGLVLDELKRPRADSCLDGPFAAGLLHHFLGVDEAAGSLTHVSRHYR